MKEFSVIKYHTTYVFVQLELFESGVLSAFKKLDNHFRCAVLDVGSHVWWGFDVGINDQINTVYTHTPGSRLAKIDAL